MKKLEILTHDGFENNKTSFYLWSLQPIIIQNLKYSLGAKSKNYASLKYFL